jgi:hypothetical protein
MRKPEGKIFLMNFSTEHKFSDLFSQKTHNAKILDDDLFIEHTKI